MEYDEEGGISFPVLCFDLSACYLLLVDSFQHLVSAYNRRFGEGLSFTQLQQDLGLFELLLVLLQGLVYVFAVFRIDN
jgi:hypothetical protein